jgi:hypothetical protein
LRVQRVEVLLASSRVAALPKAPLPPMIRFLYCFSAYPLKKAVRSSGRSRARMPRAAFVALVAERRSRAN